MDPQNPEPPFPPEPPPLAYTSSHAQADERFHAGFSRRIQWLTLVFGLAGALAVAIARTPRWGAGLAIGAVLAWLNFRWLDQALGGLVIAASAQEGRPKPVVPLSLYGKFIARYLLIGITLYVTVSFFGVPIVACLLGLFALGAGAMTAALYDVFSGSERE
jgi:amino acid transporter